MMLVYNLRLDLKNGVINYKPETIRIRFCHIIMVFEEEIDMSLILN